KFKSLGEKIRRSFSEFTKRSTSTLLSIYPSSGDGVGLSNDSNNNNNSNINTFDFGYISDDSGDQQDDFDGYGYDELNDIGNDRMLTNTDGNDSQNLINGSSSAANSSLSLNP